MTPAGTAWESNLLRNKISSMQHADMHHGTCVTPMPWCMVGSLISGFPRSLWQGERSRHSRRKRNPQFYVSCKRLITGAMTRFCPIQWWPISVIYILHTLSGLDVFWYHRDCRHYCLKIYMYVLIWNTWESHNILFFHNHIHKWYIENDLPWHFIYIPNLH